MKQAKKWGRHLKPAPVFQMVGGHAITISPTEKLDYGGDLLTHVIVQV
jgi:hypothetical protein